MPLPLHEAQSLCDKLSLRFNGLSRFAVLTFTPQELKSGTEGLFEIIACSALAVETAQQHKIRDYAARASEGKISSTEIRFELRQHARLNENLRL